MLTITISGTDRTKLVVPESLRISNILTRQVDTASFIIRKFGSRTFAPVEGNEVIISLDGTKIFGGRIVQLKEEYEKLDLVGYQVQCSDWTRDLDSRLVVQNYQNQTVEAIIADIASRYFPSSITLNHVDATAVIKQIRFNYEYPSKVLQQLAELINYDWYIDPDKDLHFFAKETNPAAFNLTDTNGKYIYESLEIRKDITPIRNTIYVRGGEYKGDVFTVEEVADGAKAVFGTGYRFSDLSVYVTGQEKSVGVDGLDNASNFDLLYNFNEKIIKFREDRKPTAGSNIKWFGQPWLPVLIKIRDNSSINTFSALEGSDGIKEFKIIDKSIESKEAARQRARAELLAYAATINEGSFTTLSDGLRAGQRINIQSTLRNINSNFVINKVDVTAIGSAADNTLKLQYKISLMTTRTFDMIDLLQKLVTQKDKEIEIAEDEILDEIESFDETVTMEEDINFTAITPPYKYGPGGNPQGRWNLSSWGS